MPAATATLHVLPIHDVDLGPVAALLNRAFGKYSSMVTSERTSPEAYRQEAGEQAHVLLLEQGGLLVATAMVADARDFIEPGDGDIAPDHPWAGALYLGLVGVEPRLMNRGTGRRLVSHAEQMAADGGFTGVALGTIREFGLVDYYERLDYRVIHREVHPPGHWDFVIDHEYCELVKHL